MEWGAWGAARGTKENGSWKKTLWLGGNWDSFISLPDLEISPHPCFGNCPPVPSQQEAKCLLCSPF